MSWIAQQLLFVPALVAEWFIARDDPRFWPISFAIGLIFLMMLCIAVLYADRLLPGRLLPESADPRGAAGGKQGRG